MICKKEGSLQKPTVTIVSQAGMSVLDTLEGTNSLGIEFDEDKNWGEKQ